MRDEDIGNAERKLHNALARQLCSVLQHECRSPANTGYVRQTDKTRTAGAHNSFLPCSMAEPKGWGRIQDKIRSLVLSFFSCRKRDFRMKNNNKG
jgi:hypothetical protein